MRTPVIAALNGHTFAGGLELACMCDIRVASAEAILCVGDADHGLLPTGGLTWTLPRLVGAGRAKWLAFSNARVTGEAAATFGLVEEAVPAAEVVDRALGLAEQIARSPGAGIGLTRDAIDHAAESGLESAMAFEIDAEHRAMAHPAVAAALDAFFQRG
jgi:2-(1,2-epoxy-1,2-dihydrophenyl)acetyl-CoA isomerase